MSTEKFEDFTISPRHAKARRFALAGVPIFPVGDDKRPLIRDAAGWWGETTDLATIDGWWRERDWNYAYRPCHLGCVVLDADLYKGVDPATLALLPPTRTVSTPSGGEHRYYRTADQLGNAKFAPTIDVRCANGYVLGPGSVIDGREYVLSDPRQPEPLPEAVRAALCRRDEPAERLVADGITLTDDDEILNAELRAAAKAFVAKHGAGVDPRGDRAYACANLLADKRHGANAADDETIFEIMHEAGFGDIGLDILERRKRGDRGIEKIAEPVVWPEIPAGKYSAAWWLGRDIPPRLKLIGPLNTASRSMIFATTGAGKTIFCMALACAVASGDSIFQGGQWQAPEPRAVLYIDGEMPLALMQERLKEALGRVRDVADRLFLVSMADCPDVPPLNTAGGQEWVDHLIETLRPALVIFDNVQALTAGDMKETDDWRAMQPWMRRLTDRDVAQIWVHHASADGTMYGDKTRAFQLDTVISLAKVEDDANVTLGLDLKFTKHRELHPTRNAAEYREGRATLQGNIWRFQDGAAIEREDIEGVLRRAARN